MTRLSQSSQERRTNDLVAKINHLSHSFAHSIVVQPTIMKPISPVLPTHPDMPEVTYAKDQPQYIPLPACNIVYADGTISCITRWHLSWKERLKILFTGCFWWEQWTFGDPLQPIHPWIVEPLKNENLTQTEMPNRDKLVKDLLGPVTD